MKTSTIVPVDTGIYLVSRKYRIPFSDFARDLLNLPNDQERTQYIQSIFEKYPEFHNAQFSNNPGFARVVLRRATGKEVKLLPVGRQQLFNNMALSYIAEVNAFRRCYYACLDTISEGPTYDSLKKVKLIHLLTDAAQSIPNLLRDRTAYIENEDFQTRYIEHCMQFAYKDLQTLPYTAFYTGFREEAAALQNAYGRSLAPRLNDKATITLWFYDNPDASQETSSLLKIHAIRFGDDSIIEDMSSSTPVSVVATKILRGLDRHTTDYIGLVNTRWDSSKRCSYWETPRVDMALYLYMMTEILSRQDIRECKICGRLFISPRSNKVYCNAHNKHQINYYNRLIKGKYDLEKDEP